MQATIAQLWTYPIKSCQGYRLSTADGLLTGLRHDRSMLVVSVDGGKMLTQRGFPAMALIAPSIDGDTVTLSAPNMPTISASMMQNHGNKTVTVWRDTVSAIDMGDDLAQWFSKALNVAVRLVRFDPDQVRKISKPLLDSPNAKHFFADGYPYLVLSLASLHALNERLLEAGSQAIPANRFRANIILDDVDAHTEDYAATFTHSSGAQFIIHSPCTRCTVPTIDQSTAQMDQEQQPTLALSAYRYDAQQDGITFGMNALLSQDTTLKEGDALSVALAF